MTAAWPWLLCALLGAAVHASPSSGRDEDLGCPAPRSPENGLSFIFNRGRLVRYRCHPGFTLRGHGQAVCHHNTWNRPAPLCLAKNATRRGGAKLPHPVEDKHGERQPFEWDSSTDRLPPVDGKLIGDQPMRRMHNGVRDSWDRDDSSTANEVPAAEQVLSRHSVHSAGSSQHLKKGHHHSVSSAEHGDREESVGLPAPREALRKQSDIPRYWRSHHGAEALSSDKNETTAHKTVSRTFKRSYLHSDDDYDLEDEDDDDDDDDNTQPTRRGDISPYDEDEEHGRNSPRTVTFERGPKGDREPYDQSPGASRSSPVDYFGRPVQVLTGEKAHQQDALLRRQYEMAEQHRRAKLEEFRAREEVRFEPPPPPPPGNAPVTSRPIDYFGRPVQVHTGEKAAQAEALLKRQYEMVQQRMQDNQLQEARKRPDTDYFPRQGVSEDERYRGDREPLPGVTSRPVDYFGRPVQVLTGAKAAQAEAMLRRQYEEYQARLSSSSRPSEPDYAEGRPVEFNRRPVQPASSPPFDHFGRPVQVLTGEKAGQQTELLRQQYDMAQRGASAFQEARGRPIEEHRHRHQHGEQGTSGALRLSREDLELMSRLSPQLRASFVRDLRQARIKEETDPERANRFLSRYRSQAASAADEMLADQPVEITTASTEDTSSDTSTESSAKATYDQSCLQDRKRGRSFLSAPKVKHAYVYKYERKVLGKPAQSHYVLARYKCLLGYTLKYAKASALYCRQRQWIGEHPTCVRSSTLSTEHQ
ncbi:hypothetical protein MTO96_001731 [Rhipicephalus appendiculatus]